MGSLFSSLQTASTALNVFSRALGTDQTNISNASTAGYAAQQVNVRAIDLSGDGAGAADFISLSSNSNAIADSGVQAASSQAAASGTSAQQLTAINSLFDITGSSGILAALQQFSSAFSTLSVTPNDATLQANALSAAGTVASAFRSVAAGLDNQQAEIDSNIATTTSQINGLAQSIQQLNVKVLGEASVDPATDASLRSDLDQLSSLVDIGVAKNANGTVSVLAGGQLPLVEGDQAFTLSANPNAAPGSQILSSAGGDSPATFSGQLGALLETRNNTLGGLLGVNGSPGTLNSLAAGFATQVNTILTSGVTSNGTTGVPIFSFDNTNPANAARSLTLNAAIAPGQLAVATTGTGAESNGVANQLAALAASTAPANQIDGFSPEGLFGSIAASVGQRLSDARTAATNDQTTLTTAQTNRQQESGVSLDREATNITTYQRAYQANAQVVQILSQLTSDTINIIGGSGAAL